MALAVVKNEKQDVIQLKVVNGTGRFTKDGRWIPNPQSEERWVDPIRDKADVERCIEYLKLKVRMAYKKNEKFTTRRNLMLFIVGINIGLRVSDLSALKWSNFFEKDMETFVNARNKKEKKTGKKKLVIPNESIQNIITWYLSETGTQPEYDAPVFISYNTGKAIGRDPVENMMKDLQYHLKLKGSYNTHSLRKTNAYQKYMMLVEAGDPLALPKIQHSLNHRNTSETLRYLGLTRDDDIKDQFALDDWWDM